MVGDLGGSALMHDTAGHTLIVSVHLATQSTYHRTHGHAPHALPRIASAAPSPSSAT